MKSDFNGPTNLPAHHRAESMRTNFGPTMPTMKPAAPKVDLAFMLHVVKRWWKIVVPVGVVMAVCSSAAIWYLHTPRYRANAIVMIREAAPFVVYEKGVNAESKVDVFVQTQIELLRSPMVLHEVVSSEEIGNVEELRLARDRIEFLRENLEIRQVGKSELYSIGFESHSARSAAAVANAVVYSYLDRLDTERKSQVNRVLKVLEDESKLRQQGVQLLRSKVLDLAKHVTGKDPFGQNATTSLDQPDQIGAGVYESLVKSQVEQAVLRAQIASLESGSGEESESPENAGMLELQVERHADVQKLRSDLAAATADGDAFRTKSSRVDWQKDPKYELIKQNIAKLEGTLKSRQQSLRTELKTINAATRQAENQARLNEFKEKLGSLESESKLLQERFDEQVSQIAARGEKSVELEFARSQLAQEERVYEMIAARRVALQTEQFAPARVELANAATVPTLPIEKVPVKFIAIAILVSLGLPVALAIAYELTVHRIHSAEQLHQDTHLHVIGEIAQFPLRYAHAYAGPMPARMRQGMLAYAESVDALRTNLLLAETDVHRQVIVVTSAVSGEGKTSMATSLAVSLAESSEKQTVIIDADLRSPDVANVLRCTNGPGLAEVLAGQCELDEALQRHKALENLYILPAGRAKASPHQLAKFDDVQKVLAQLRPRFTHIVVDTSPVLGASESMVFAKNADAVLLSSLSGQTRSREIRTVVERLRRAGCAIVGTVLNGVPLSSYACQYYAKSSDAAANWNPRLHSPRLNGNS